MYQTLELALNQYASLWNMWRPALTGVLLVSVGILAIIKGEGSPFLRNLIQATGFVSVLVGASLVLMSISLQMDRTEQVNRVKIILSSPAWEIEKATVSTDKALENFTLSTTAESEEIEIMGKTVAAKTHRESITVEGELMDILLQSPQVAAELGSKTTIAKTN